MPSIEERNIATLELWLNEVHANRQVDLAAELLAPSYTRHLPDGTETLTPESAIELSESAILSRPRFRYGWLEIIARGDRISVLCRTDEHNDEREPHNSLGIYRFEGGKLAEVWQPKLSRDAEAWPTDSRSRDEWSIASTESLTVDEEANLAAVRRWTDLQENRSDDFEAVAEVMADTVIAHGGSGTRPRTRDEVIRFLVEFREDAPGYQGLTDDLFVAGDLAARRYRYIYAEPLPDRGSFQCGVVLYRFENHRIAEYWNIYLPNDMDWE